MMLPTRKPTTHEQMLLAFELYHRIPRGRKVTAQELKFELESAGIKRDIRTIQRNLDIVVEYLGVDKDTNSKPYGYSKRHASYIGFNATDIVLLNLAGKTLLSVFPKQSRPIIQKAFQTLLEQFPIALKFKAEVPLQDKVTVIQANQQITDFHLSVIDSLCYALYYQYNINLLLTNKEQVLIVKPLGITLMSNELVLIIENQEGEINSHNFGDIQQVEVSTFHFEYPKHFSLSDYTLAKKQSTNQVEELQPNYVA